MPVWHSVFDTAVSCGQVTQSAELPFLFKNLPIGQLSVFLLCYWAAFVQHSNPHAKGLPAWPAFAPTYAGLQFDVCGVYQIKDVRPGACAHLDLP